MTGWELFAMEMGKAAENASSALLAFGRVVAESVHSGIYSAIDRARLEVEAERERMRAVKQIRDVLAVQTEEEI